MNTFAKPKEENKKNFLSHVAAYRFDFSFDNTAVLRYVPHFVFLAFLGVLYISNNYYSDRIMRKMAVLDREVEQLRVDYSSLKYQYIQAGRLSEVSLKVKHLGLVENDKNLVKINNKD